MQQIQDVISTYLLPLFSSKSAIAAVSVSTGKADEVEAGFQKMGFAVERKELPTIGGDEGSEGSEGSESGEEGEVDEAMEDRRSP